MTHLVVVCKFSGALLRNVVWEEVQKSWVHVSCGSCRRASISWCGYLCVRGRQVTRVLRALHWNGKADIVPPEVSLVAFNLVSCFQITGSSLFMEKEVILRLEDVGDGGGA